jgi:hypothetical protein
LRLFAGSYQRGQGAQVTAYHYLDVADARVLFADVASGAAVDYCDFKGTPNSEGPQSRVFKVKSQRNGGKVWFRLENGPGEPQAVVNIPFESWEARKLALAVLSYLQAAEVLDIMLRQLGSWGRCKEGNTVGPPDGLAVGDPVLREEGGRERPSRARTNDRQPTT